MTATPTVMYDSINLNAIPKNAPAVAGYVGGNWPTYAKLAKEFPNAVRVSIAVASRYYADILDIEPGDAPLNLADEWMRAQFSRGAKYPGVYCSVSDAQQVIGILAKAGYKRNQYRLWTAHYTHVAHTCTPKCYPTFKDYADATQWTNKALGRNLDQSLCKKSFWQRPGVVARAAVSAKTKTNAMVVDRILKIHPDWAGHSLKWIRDRYRKVTGK